MRGRGADPLPVLHEAERIVEAASDFGHRAPNWEIQKQHEAEWVIPVIEILQELQPTRVLDLGCGYGTLAVCGALLGHEVVAADWFVPSLPVIGIEWQQLNTQVPGCLPEGPFGLVIMTEVLEHLNFHPGALFSEIYARVQPGGRFVGATPAPENWQEDLPVKKLEDMPSWSVHAEAVDAHIHFCPEAELKTLLSSAGFVLLRLFLLRRGFRRFWEASK